MIYNILKISVSKRIKGYGTLRAIGGEKGQLYQIIVIEVILLCLIGIPIGMLLGFLSARGILEAATGLVSPELFLVQDASELKTLIAENSSLNGTFTGFKRSNHFGVCAVCSIASSQISRKGIPHYGDVWNKSENSPQKA